MRLGLLMLVLGLVFTACSTGRGARKQASLDFHCDTDQLRVTRRSHDTYVVAGCDRQGIYQCPEGPGISSRFCVNLALMARQRGEREFRCEFARVGVDEISPFVFRVAGCGREALFHCEASDGRARCLTEREESAPAPAPTADVAADVPAADAPVADAPPAAAE